MLVFKKFSYYFHRPLQESIFFERIFQVQEPETLVAEAFVVLADKFVIHKAAAVCKLGGKAFALGLDDGYAVDCSVRFTVQEQEIGHILADINLRMPVLFIAIYLKVGKRVIAVEVQFQFFVLQ